jgi:predicted aldo/keto reductase-like oxidoreductase
MKTQQKNDHPRAMGRRQFIGASAAALASVGFSAPAGRCGQTASPQGAGDAPKIKEYRTLGRTGFKVSDIGLGGGEVTDSALFQAVLDRGINYIDTAENYVNGQMERAVGKALKDRDRKSVFITTKLYIRDAKVAKQEVLDRTRKCLERLETEYVDCMQMHCPPTVAVLQAPGFHDAMKDLKAEGRVRFVGLSQHGAQWNEAPETMERVLTAAAEDGRFDLALFVYNFIQRDQGERVLRVFKEKNIAATIMKANPVGTYTWIAEQVEKAKNSGEKMPDYLPALLERVKKVADQADSFRKTQNLANDAELLVAAHRFVLAHPDVHTVCCMIANYSDLDTFTSLSGTKLSESEENKLGAYAGTYGQFYCRHACGECESSCPRGVPVNTIMRFRHYFSAQGREKHAMSEYAGLGAVRADLCSGCAGPCQQACPYGVPIQAMLALAHDTLTLA